MLIPLSFRLKFRSFLAPLANVLSAGHVSPNVLTLVGFAPALAAGYAFGKGMIRLGGVCVGLSGLFDLLDGLVAKLADRRTVFGALLDSTIDRYGEIAIFIGLAIHFKGTPSLYGVVIALGGSLMVSYLRARAEGLGFSCEVGMLQRPERVIVILVGALLGESYLKWAVWIVAVLANLTAIERLFRLKELMGTSKL